MTADPTPPTEQDHEAYLAGLCRTMPSLGPAIARIRAEAEARGYRAARERIKALESALRELVDLNSGWHGFPADEQARFNAATEAGRRALEPEQQP